MTGVDEKRLRPAEPARHELTTGGSGETVCRPAEEDEFLSAENVHILESWNTVHDPGLSIARARLEPGQETRPHSLTGTIERYLIVAGRGEVHVGELDPQSVAPGAVVYVPAGIEQSIRNTGSSDLVFYCLCTPRFRESHYRHAAGHQD